MRHHCTSLRGTRTVMRSFVAPLFCLVSCLGSAPEYELKSMQDHVRDDVLRGVLDQLPEYRLPHLTALHARARPFPHTVLDGLLSPLVLEKIQVEFQAALGDAECNTSRDKAVRCHLTFGKQEQRAVGDISVKEALKYASEKIHISIPNYGKILQGRVQALIRHPGTEIIPGEVWEEFLLQYLVQEGKVALGRIDNMGTFTKSVIAALSSPRFVRVLEELTGIPSLKPDPMLMGGGLHQTPQGGSLAIHSDFPLCIWAAYESQAKAEAAGASTNDQGCVAQDTGTCQGLGTDPRCIINEVETTTPSAAPTLMTHGIGRVKWRRVNVFLYFNEHWNSSWGGDLELYDSTMERKEASIAPIANRLVIVTNGPLHFHGHPSPLACPPDRFRRSIALVSVAKHG